MHFNLIPQSFFFSLTGSVQFHLNQSRSLLVLTLFKILPFQFSQATNSQVTHRWTPTTIRGCFISPSPTSRFKNIGPCPIRPNRSFAKWMFSSTKSGLRDKRWCSQRSKLVGGANTCAGSLSPEVKVRGWDTAKGICCLEGRWQVLLGLYWHWKSLLLGMIELLVLMTEHVLLLGMPYHLGRSKWVVITWRRRRLHE